MKIDIDTKHLNAKLNDAIDQGLHSLDQGLRRLEEVRDTIKSRSGELRKKARHQWKDNRGKIVDVEKQVESHVRQNSNFYIAAGVGLLAIIVAKMIFGRRHLTR